MEETITIISSFSEEGWEAYARQGLTSLVAHFPPTVHWQWYYEHTPPSDVPPGVHLIDLLSYAPLRVFLQDFCTSPQQAGITEEGHYSISRDAAKFCRKVYAQTWAAQTAGTDVLIWCDADMTLREDFSLVALHALLPKKYFCAYLGRQTSYSETGFLAFRLTHPACQEFMARYARQYDAGLCFQEKLWHDCRQFDVVRQQMEQEGKILSFDLTNPQTEKHPVNNSPYLPGLTHYKGTRKQQLSDL